MLELIKICFTFSFYVVLLMIAYLAILYLVRRKLKSRSNKLYGKAKVISFLHPFCNDCGGGEKVLWMIVKAMTSNTSRGERNIKINILCGVKDDANVIKKNLRDRFELDFTPNEKSNILDIEIVRLKTANMLKPKSFMTMFLQIVGQIIFAFEIATTVHQDTIIDTTGLPFTYIILRLLGNAEMVAYVHYPFISEDMISDIRKGIEGVHSRGIFGRLKFLRLFKIFYYHLILFFYKLNGLAINLAFCNSSWTYNHMKKIWPKVKSITLYPPCSTQLYENQVRSSMKENSIVTCAQFRPEKRQKMQIDIFNKLRQRTNLKDIKMSIIGSIRDEADRKLFNELQDYIQTLGLENQIELCPNLSLNEVKKKFSTAKIGLHTMRDEHFGISVIEMMAAGLITIAHNSAGPLNDIIGPAPYIVGILAKDEDDYVEQLQEALEKYPIIYNNISTNANLWVKKFSNEEFMKLFVKICEQNNIF